MSFSLMKKRLLYQGGASQHERLIKDKLRSFKAARKQSYQAAHFNLYPDFPGVVWGLFNPVTQTLDYDTKLISVPFDAQFRVGDVFRWDETGTFWICYSQDRTELAYFRGSCRRCDYKIRWIDGDRREQETFASIVGPNQPLKNMRSDGSIIVEQPNANLTVLVPDSIINHEYFAPNQRFVIKGQTWEVSDINDFSMPGVIRLYAVKTYTNLIDNDIEQDIHNAWNIQPVVPHYQNENGIIGSLTMKPIFEQEYHAIEPGGEWVIVENIGKNKNKLPVEFVEQNVLQQVIHIKWTKMTSGSFTLGYRKPGGDMLFQKHIIVESLM